MRAIIIAAGISSRLRPLTDHTPKPMIEVGGKKILERTIEQLKQAGITDIVINTYYLPEVISSYFGNGSNWGVEITYFKENDLIGTAGALKRMAKLVGDQPVLFVYGDNIFQMDFKKFIIQAQTSPCLATITVFNKTINKYSGAAGGVVEAEGNYVKNLWAGKDRPDLNLVNAALYWLRPEILNYIPEDTVYDFHKDLFPALLAQGQKLEIYKLAPSEAVFGIDTPDFLKNTEEYLRQNL